MYYPKSEISLVSTTSGREFLVKKTKKPYTGDYYITNDGKLFSGKEYTVNTQELIPIVQKIIVKNEKESYGFHYAMPSEDDYSKGSFTRYTIKRVNSGFETILEVDQTEYERAAKDPLYTAVKFSWKITGTRYTTPEGIPGIVNTNQKTLENLEKTIPGISNYFTNLAQYAK
jgi:dTDP-4-dehydrorhamnose reductase